MGSGREIEILERIANLLRAETRLAAQRSGIQPVQLEILEYLDRCNRYSDTPAAVAEYLSLTKGTVSQSIQRLEEKGFIIRAPDPNDGRISRLRLSRKGRSVVNSKSRQALATAAERADFEGRTLAEALERLLGALQRANGLRSFGVCQTCRFFEHGEDGRSRCGLTAEPLSADDRLLVCREHEEKPSLSGARQ
ncbi:MAG: MarR family winged helix-turn-helix transcriptional regulator [Myxococcota bacterium]